MASDGQVGIPKREEKLERLFYLVGGHCPPTHNEFNRGLNGLSVKIRSSRTPSLVIISGIRFRYREASFETRFRSAHEVPR